MVELANSLANYHYIRGEYDSAIVHYWHAIAAFGRAGLGSSRGARPGAPLLSTHLAWTGGWSVASSLANAGSALRHSGGLRQALRCYERARALYQRQHHLPGIVWTQSRVGEAYAEQGSPPQALPAYEQALRATRAYQRQKPTQGSQLLADTVRAAQQFVVVATEARFRTREQAGQIRLLTERNQQQMLRVRLAAALALLLLGAGAAWRTTRRLNGQLAAQGTRLQAQAEHLGALDAAKNQFFANVSHELRTPLTLVLGPLDGLLTTPAALASLLCLSERTLYRRLGELAGLTPGAWLSELRFDHARRLLEAGSFGSVAAVAGFANAKYLSARYAERFGRRPGEYAQ